MPVFSVALILASAVLHATWNFLIKRAGASGSAFVWLFTMPSVIALAPIALWILSTGSFSLTGGGAAFLAGSAVLHTVYFLLLGRGYKVGDLSVVYPLARGTGPLLAGGIAIIALGERPTVPIVAGALCIAGGAALLARERRVPAAAMSTGHRLCRFNTDLRLVC